MSVLLRRSNGVYYAITCDRGRRCWLSLRTRDITEAQALFDDFERERRSRREGRLSMILQEFKTRKSPYVQSTTIDLYEAAVVNFIRHCGDRPVKSIGIREAERFVALRLKEVKPVTVNIDLRQLRALFNDALRLRLIRESPFSSVKLLPRSEAEGVALTEADIRRLAMVTKDPGYLDLIRFTVYTLLRRGELIHLCWSDIELERGLIYIRSKPGFKVKGGKSRVMVMNDWVDHYLRNKPRISPYVFSKPNGFPLTGSWVSHTFKKYVRRAELDERVHFHTLRHTGISMLINRGVPAPFVQKLAGHSSPFTTQIYTHIEEQSLRSAVGFFPNLN